MTQHDPFTVEETKARRNEVLKRYEDRNQNDIRRVLSTPEGRRFIWRILGETKILRSCFDTNGLTMAFNEGKRDIGLFMTRAIEFANVEAMEQMRSEAASDRLIREAEMAKAEEEQEKK